MVWIEDVMGITVSAIMGWFGWTRCRQPENRAMVSGSLWQCALLAGMQADTVAFGIFNKGGEALRHGELGLQQLAACGHGSLGGGFAIGTFKEYGGAAVPCGGGLGVKPEHAASAVALPIGGE